MIKIEMHCHTRHSPDGFITTYQLAEQCNKKAIGCVCIADHNVMRGAVEFAERVPLKIIVGEEIKTQAGEVIGLFLTDQIQPGLSLEQTIEEIKKQGGIVYLPHPFDEFRDSAVKLSDAEKIKDKLDVIEIFNSRTFNPKYNQMAVEFAKANDIVTAVGSDAHHRLELGNCYMQMNDFSGPESFLESLRGATYTAKKCPFILRVYIKGLKILTGKK